jgi:anti-sigma regulatory factor (Ser/Thr protein kinase)
MAEPRRSRSLRPRARILRTFGDELISSPVVAVIELVKNAYDADASRVLVSFVEPLDTPGNGAIEVIDDGHGMTLATIEETWMEPATLYRKRNPRSEGLQRRVLAEKGIGRFAASRLADDLEVVTRRVEDALETHVSFDWRAFDDEELYLDEVRAEVWEEHPLEFTEARLSSRFGLDVSDSALSPHGTLLRMRGLRQVWGEEEIAQLRIGLARLISPFGYESGSEHGFRILLEVPGMDHASGLVEPPELLQHPPYLLRGRICADGAYDLDVRVSDSGKPHNLAGQFLIDGRDPTLRATNLDCCANEPSWRKCAQRTSGETKRAEHFVTHPRGS